ncbi:probable LRR receptor-like serine/threonine-protein kinase At3g47570 [Arachis ipaensis]|uniref:probable LRR receptor-like serine/threonine-protein kinase At3g47570 n=1 Tax=Arachis ipaensis TaxID=130454 RepID=UPI000A2AF145|nr:probable LRR receptor-like serine/threonine-protein kinase At3g47570 [Arachis ipaensis]XP_029152406.1 probable LRR receptor-like serine/threonine-protein kinase At3g47570 [Arachis hypogaea]
MKLLNMLIEIVKLNILADLMSAANTPSETPSSQEQGSTADASIGTQKNNNRAKNDLAWVILIRGGGIHRFKLHLAGKGGDVESCRKVPAAVRHQFHENQLDLEDDRKDDGANNSVENANQNETNQDVAPHLKKSKKLSFSPSLKHRYLKVSYGELHQATNGFSSSNLVDTGSSGSVYRETLVYFERPVAVKVLNLQTGGASKSFMAECKALGIIKHRNLLSLLASCSSVNYKENDFKAIVFEFMSNRSLKTLLYNTIEDSESTNLSLNLMQRVNIALDIAFALDYIHNDSGVVIHCDIKPSNMLLDDDIVARLGDFGLARLISRGQKLFYQ